MRDSHAHLYCRDLEICLALGIPYGYAYEAYDQKYPGYVRSIGVAFDYQRFCWKGAYTAIHAMNALQRSDNRKIQNGYQLFMTYRMAALSEMAVASAPVRGVMAESTLALLVAVNDADKTYRELLTSGD